MTYGVYATGVEDYGSTPTWAGTSPIPSVAVEVAFTTAPGAVPVWVNIGERVKQFTVHRGRADELTAFSAGQATIVLNNEDRAFDPVYTSSPYYPNVVPMRRIRIRATYNAVTYDVFSGYVTNWQQQYRHPADADAVVEATDAFKVLGNITLPQSVYMAEILTDSPSHLWRLGEPAGSTTANDTIGGAPLTIYGPPELGAAGIVTRDPGSSARFNTTGYPRAERDGNIITTYPFTVEAVIKTTGGMEIYSDGFDPGAPGGILDFSVVGSGQLQFLIAYTGATAFLNLLSTASVNDNNPHHVAAVVESGLSARLYIDGVEANLAINTTANLAIPSTRYKMMLGNQSTAPSANPSTAGYLQMVATYPTALPSARVAAHAAARATPWQSDLTGVRLGRLLDAAGWPAADRNIDTGSSTLQSADLGSNALSAVQAVEQTEFGALFVTAAGQVRFIARDSLLKAPYASSQATFGDSGAELEFGDLTFEYDDKLIYNEAVVSRLNGSAQTLGDTTSQGKYLKRTKTVSGLLHQSDQTSRDAAQWILNHYKDPLLRVTGMRLEPSANNDATHFPQVLGRDLLDRVTVVRRPQNLGAAITQDSQIQGITHTVTPKAWVTHWDLSPAETQVYWILEVAGRSELDQTTRLGF